MPKKPIKYSIKYSIKVWMAADSKTRYVSNYCIYLGTSARGEVRLPTKVVLNLTEPFQHCNPLIYFDNFFASLKLVEELLRWGIYSLVVVYILVSFRCVNLQYIYNGGFVSTLAIGRSCRTHLQFRLELAKQLIGGYSGRKRYAGKKEEHRSL